MTRCLSHRLPTVTQSLCGSALGFLHCPLSITTWHSEIHSVVVLPSPQLMPKTQSIFWVLICIIFLCTLTDNAGWGDFVYLKLDSFTSLPVCLPRAVDQVFSLRTPLVARLTNIGSIIHPPTTFILSREIHDFLAE